MLVVSVNTGRAQALDVRGRTVSSAIDKRAVSSPQRVEKLGLAGDQRATPRKFGEADHAVYAYPFEHYAHWQRLLGGGPFWHGRFGENLTITGLLETRARIGDVLRIGSSVLQVTQPRIPCGRLSAHMGGSFSGAFLRSRRVGFYLRVVETGSVQAGDSMQLVESSPLAPGIDDFVRISQLDYWDADGLASLLSYPGLMLPWRELLDEKLQRARAATGWLGLRELLIAKRVDEPTGEVSLTLTCALNRPLPPFREGEFLQVVTRPHPVPREARRLHPIIGDPADGEAYRIIVSVDEARQVGEKVYAGAPVRG